MHCIFMCSQICTMYRFIIKQIIILILINDIYRHLTDAWTTLAGIISLPFLSYILSSIRNCCRLRLVFTPDGRTSNAARYIHAHAQRCTHAHTCRPKNPKYLRGPIGLNKHLGLAEVNTVTETLKLVTWWRQLLVGFLHQAMECTWYR